MTTLHPDTRPADAVAPRRAVPSGAAFAAVLAAVVATAVALGWLLWPSAPGPTVLHTGTATYAVTVTVDSTRVGMTGVEVDLTGRTAATPPATAVEVDPVMPLMGHATPPAAAQPLGDGRHHADGVELMMTGPWELRLSISSRGGVEYLTLPLAVSG